MRRAHLDEPSELAKVETLIEETDAELRKVKKKLEPLEEKGRRNLNDEDRQELDALRKREEQLREDKRQLREEKLLLLRKKQGEDELAKKMSRLELDNTNLKKELTGVKKTLTLTQTFRSSWIDLLDMDRVFPAVVASKLKKKAPTLQVLDAALKKRLLEGKEESAVQALMVEVLTEPCALAGLWLEDTHVKAIRGYPRRPDVCVLEKSVMLTIREVKLTVELKIRGLLKDARKQVEEYLREQALADGAAHRMEYFGVGCDGFQVQFCRLHCEADVWKFAVSKEFSLWENDVVGGNVSWETYQLLFRALCKAKTLQDRTSVGVCSELRAVVGAKKARFGLISDDEHHVVYWSNHGGGFVLKGYSEESEAHREFKASVKAKESLVHRLKKHVPSVEYLGNSNSNSDKFWLKLTPLGLCSLAECDWLFGLLPLEASESEKEDLFDSLKEYMGLLEVVLRALHEKGVFHCDVKPENVVLVHKNQGLTEARLARSLFPVLIDFSAFDDGLITTTVWFASKALLLKGGISPQGSDDLESLFWTAVEVFSRGTFISSLRALVQEKGGSSPTRLKDDSSQEDFSINGLVVECRKVFLAELTGGGKKGGRLWNLLFLPDHSFNYLQHLAHEWDLHRIYA